MQENLKNNMVEEVEEEYQPNSLDLLMFEILKEMIIPEEPFFEPINIES